jgi:hypothetical protein
MFRLAVLLTLLAAPNFAAALTARYIRVDNPTGFVMEVRQIEVYSEGKNLALHQRQAITGTCPPRPENLHPTRANIVLTGDREANEITNGDTNVAHRASEWRAYVNPVDNSQCWNPWLELDLGREAPIDRIVIYGSRYPERVYLDKGHRVVAALGEDRAVRWAAHWQYYDTARYPKGVFEWTPSAADPDCRAVVGRVVPLRADDWAPMGWLLDADASQPPADAAQRRQRFAERDSPANLEALARDLFPLLDDSRPDLAPAFAQYRAGHWQAALDAWKRAWFAKMAKANLHVALHADFNGYSSQGDDLLAGLMVTINPNEARAIRYTPGEIPWIQVPADGKNLGPALSDCERKAQVGRVCWPLLAAWRRHPDARYLARWAEILDDWALNFFPDAGQSPYEVENLFTFNPAHAWGTFMEDLSDAAVEHPETIDRVPAATLARVQLLSLEKYSTAWWRQARETVFNHNTGGLYAWSLITGYVDEFHAGQRAADELRDGLERFMTMATERDGSLTEIGDEGHQEIPNILGYTFDLLDHNPPAWYTAGWRNRALEWYDNLYKYMFRHLSPGGYEHRFAVDYRPRRWLSTAKIYWLDRARFHIWDRDAEFYAIPEIRRLLDAWGHVSAGGPMLVDPLLKPVYEAQRRSHDDVAALLGDNRPGLPHLNSDWMPYTGAYYFRGGWNEDAPFLAMMACGSHGGSQAPQWPYSMWYHYDLGYPLVAAQPVQIDGLPPQQLFGRLNCYEPGTKTMCLTNADERPAPHRWLSDARYDFGEALFVGGYQRYPGFKGNWDGSDLQQLDAGPFVADVHSLRQIIQLHGLHLFIVTDAVQTPGEAAHELTVPYKVSLSARGAGKALAPEQLALDPAAGRLGSDNPEGPSVTLHQFADRSLRYRREQPAKPDYRAYRARLGDQIGIADQPVTLQARGNRLTLATLIESRAKGAGPRIVVCEPLTAEGAVGFHAKLAEGGEIWYQSAGQGRARLAAGPAYAEGQALLTVRAGGAVSGLLLGGASLAIDGQTVALPAPDVEFGPDGLKPFYAPIDPVRFEPARTAFAETETVTMVSATPNVEIHYTTDATPPTLASPRYTGPIQISDSTWFAARAWRQGPDGRVLPAEDFEINGTRFTVPSYANFERQPYRPAAAARAAELAPGLNYDLLKAPWWRLYAEAHWLPAVGGGHVAREMDLDPIAGPEPYGARFKGFLKVPTDGVYTFTVPPELRSMDDAPSYDLRAYLDGQQWRPSQFWHAHGTWSVPLRVGYHRFQVDFADARSTPWRRSGIWRFYPRPWAVHKGPPGAILLSGPRLEPQRIPADWLWREK